MLGAFLSRSQHFIACTKILQFHFRVVIHFVFLFFSSFRSMFVFHVGVVFSSAFCVCLTNDSQYKFSHLVISHMIRWMVCSTFQASMPIEVLDHGPTLGTCTVGFFQLNGFTAIYIGKISAMDFVRGVCWGKQGVVWYT